MLTLTDITLRRGPELLFENLSLSVHPGWRLGVVGRNGTGKSSLFALLLGELGADAGEMAVPRGLSIATVAQETPSTLDSALDYVLDGDTELRTIERSLARAEADDDAHAIAAAHERLSQIDGYAAHARAGSMLHGLGFSSTAQTAPVAEFSGGWRMRLNLARALMQRADLLLLDEPTNHLDLDAVLWLQRTLAGYAGTLLVISHDRDFLDATTTHTLHLHGRRARLYTGNYSSFESQRAQQLAVQAAQHDKQQRQIAHLQRFVDRFRAKATKARQAQARLKMIERLPKVAPVHADMGFDFEFREPARLPEPLIKLDGAAAGYDGAPLLEELDRTLAPGDRIGLLGPNGAGKSTFVRLLAGELPALAGERVPHTHLNVGYFAQHQLDQLDVDASPLAHLLALDPKLAEQAARNYLGGFAFRGDRVFEPVRLFSGGERARLALALLIFRRPNLLLLDEPTNHLDLDMRHALELALHGFAGAVVTVSHDRHLIRATCDALWLVADGTVRTFDGDLDDYARWLAGRQDSGSVAGTVTPTKRGPDDSTASAEEGQVRPKRQSPRDRRRAAAEQRAHDKVLRDRVRLLEEQIAEEQARLAEVERALADPNGHAGNDHAGADVESLLEQHSERKHRLEAAEQEWLAAAESLEASAASR